MLILLIGIVAALAILAATVLMVSANVQGGTTADSERATTFNVAEAGLDATIYGLGNTWPTATSPYALSGDDLAAFRSDFVDYPDPPAGKQFLTVSVYDGPPYAGSDANGIPWSATNEATFDANNDGMLWAESQANVGEKAARIRVELLRQSLPAPVLGAVVYSGAEAKKTGSGDITSALMNGQPTGAVYVNGSFSEGGSGDRSTVTLKVENDPSTSPPNPFPTLSQFLPDDYVQSLIVASKAASSTALPANTYTGELKPSKGTYAAPIRVNGNLKISGSGDYSFGSVYVTGDAQYSGSGTCSFAALYVGGNLDFSGSADKTWGPTYVGGNLKLTGSGHLNVGLIVAGGDIDVAGSGDIAGDGVGANAKPATIITIGETKNIQWTGSGNYYGLLATMLGEFHHAGSGDVYGSELAGKGWEQNGSGDIHFDGNVSANMGNIYITTMVNNTWQQISPQ